MEPEGESVEVMTVAPGGSPWVLPWVLKVVDADTEADTEAGECQEPLELDSGCLDEA